MLGVVLAGGRSTRMGTDKGLMITGTGNWAQLAAEKLDALGIPVVVSVNAAQYNAYAAVFAAGQLVVDDEWLGIEGPLLGILSVHRAYPGEDLLVLACDMPLMTSEVLLQLQAVWGLVKKEACVFVNSDGPQPLCAIYGAHGLQRIASLHRVQPLPRFSMKYILEQLDVEYILLQPAQEPAFRNFNERTGWNER